MVIASHWVGFTFPGMIEEPGSFSGIKISPMPERGPDANKRMSLAILNKLIANWRNAPWVSTSASWAANASNLLSAVTNGKPVNFAI